ncbi:MAG: hypothetical protein JOZ02_21445, partial [Acidobacteria bacterium]|nr:hypothetical protein [Acidobacteriota bacterium]
EPDPSEVAQWRWVTLAELWRGLNEEPQLYSRWLKLAVEGQHWRGVAAHDGVGPDAD